VTDRLPLLKPGEAARLLNVSRSWLYQAVAEHRVPHVRLGGPCGPVRFVADELEQWVAEQHHRPTAA
jgi:excisionase family DNA binding protein